MVVPTVLVDRYKDFVVPEHFVFTQVFQLFCLAMEGTHTQCQAQDWKIF